MIERNKGCEINVVTERKPGRGASEGGRWLSRGHGERDLRLHLLYEPYLRQVCAASIDSMMLPATFSTQVQPNSKVFPPQSSRYSSVTRRGALKHASLGDTTHGKILFQSGGFSSVTQENNCITNGRSNRKEACKHLYVAALSFGSSEDDSSSLPSEEIKIDLNLPRRRLQISFTCDACGVRSQRIINPHAYARGTVFVQCAGCEVYHKLVDNLGLIEEIDFRLETDPKVGLEEAILDNDDQTFDTL